MSEFARRNLIIAEGLSSNIEDSEKEQIFHLERAAKDLELDLKLDQDTSNKDIEKFKAILWKEVNKNSKFKLSIPKISFPEISFFKKLVKIFFYFSALALAIILIKNSLPIKKLKWEARYYNNNKFEGKELLNTQHDKISFNWEGHKPNNSVKADRFSAIYKSCLSLNRESHISLILGSDDGSKLFINNNEIINNWRKQGYKELKKDIALGKGTHKFEIHYFQHGGSSRLEFAIEVKQDVNPAKYKLSQCQ